MLREAITGELLLKLPAAESWIPAARSRSWSKRATMDAFVHLTSSL